MGDMPNTTTATFPCPVCGRTFARRNALGSHMRVHAPKESRPVLVCPECGRECKGERGLKSHMTLKHDPETNRKVSENSKRMWSDKEFHDRTVERIAETNRSDEGRRRISEGTSRGLNRPEVRRRLSEASKANWEDPEYRERLTRINGERARSEESRRNHSEAMKRKWADPAYRERVSMKASIGSNRPDVIEVKRRNSKAMWEGERGRARRAVQSSPEARVNMSRSAKRYWENVSDEQYEEFRRMRSRVSKETNSRPEVRAKISDSMHRFYESLTPEQIRERELSTPQSIYSRYKRGHIENRHGIPVFWIGSYELRFCELMLQDPDVVDFDRAGFGVRCEGVRHMYIPDFMVWRTNGTIDVVEIKSSYGARTDPMVPYEMEAGKSYCEAHGMTYRFLTESELDRYESTIKEIANG